MVLITVVMVMMRLLLFAKVSSSTLSDNHPTAINYLCHSDKCLAPYYGSCSFTRVCEVTDLDVNCGLCRPGFARNPAAIFGDCIGKLSLAFKLQCLRSQGL